MTVTETRLVVLVLSWLRENGPGTSPQISRAIGRDPGLVNASLRKYERTGHVRRVGEEPNPAGRAATIYELVNKNEQEVPEVYGNENGTATTLADDEQEVSVPESAQEPTGPSAQELRDANETDELRADDMDELLAAYCGGLTLAECDSTVLLFVLRMRRVQDRLREVEAGATD